MTVQVLAGTMFGNHCSILYKVVGQCLAIQGGGAVLGYTRGWGNAWLYKGVGQCLVIQGGGAVPGYTWGWGNAWLYKGAGQCLAIQGGGAVLGYAMIICTLKAVI